MIRSIISILLSVAIAFLPRAAQCAIIIGGPVLVPPPSSGTNPTNTNLVVWYNLSDANDSHSGAHHFTTTSGITYTSAKVGNGMLSDSSGEFLGIADWGTIVSGSFSVCLWVNLPTPTGSYKGLFSQYSSGSHGWIVGIDSTGHPDFEVSSTTGGATNDVTSSDVLSGSTWYFITAVLTASTRQEIFINGVTKGNDTTSIPSTAADSTADLDLGKYSGGTAMLGQYDSVAIFSKALTQAEIDWLYNSGSGRQYSDL